MRQVTRPASFTSPFFTFPIFLWQEGSGSSESGSSESKCVPLFGGRNEYSVGYSHPRGSGDRIVRILVALYMYCKQQMGSIGGY